MPPRPHSRKRSSSSPSFNIHDNPDEDQENQIQHDNKQQRSTTNQHLTPSKPPASKKPRYDDKNEMYIKAAISEIQLEIDSRCQQIRQHAETLAFTLKCNMKAEVSKIPRRVRDLPMSTFCTTYASDVSRVLTEDTASAQREFDTWIAQTPRLATARKHVASVARTTRASARKQGLVVPPVVMGPPAAVPASSRATRANARTKPAAAVYETPSRAAAGKPRQVARTRKDTDASGDECESDTDSNVAGSRAGSGLVSTLDTLQAQLTVPVAAADKQLVQAKLKAMQEAMATMIKQMG